MLSNIFSPFLLLSLGKNMSYDLRYDPSHLSLSDFEEGIGLVQREHQKVGDIIPMSWTLGSWLGGTCWWQVLHRGWLGWEDWRIFSWYMGQERLHCCRWSCLFCTEISGQAGHYCWYKPISSVFAALVSSPVLLDFNSAVQKVAAFLYLLMWT